MANITPVKTWTTNEILTATALNAEFTNVYNNAVGLTQAQTISGRKTFSGGVIVDEILSVAAAGSGDIKVTEIRWDPASGTATDADGMYVSWYSDDDGGTDTEYGRQHLEFVDTGAASEDSAWHFSVQVAATLTDVLTLAGANLSPSTSDGLALGTTSLMWSDLFLASGGVINFNNGNMAMTHGAGYVNLSAGKWFINDTANANTTNGFTVNIGAADDQAACYKSSDVAHGFSTGATGIYLYGTETDDFFALGKVSGALGGTSMVALGEDSASLPQVMIVGAIGGQASTTKTTGGVGMFDFYAAEHNGSGTIADVTADGVVLAVRCRKGSGTNAIFLIDEDGDYFYDGADGGAFDTYADAEAVRAFAHATSNPAQIVRSKWDDMVRYERADLTKMGVLGEITPEEEAEGHRPLVNGAQVQRLHTGAIWQNHVDIMETREAMQAELDKRDSRLALLTAEITSIKNRLN